MEQIVELLFFCLRQKTKRSIHVGFFAEMVKVRERVKGKSEKSSLCCLQAVQMQVWGTPSQSVHSCSPGWKVGGKERGSRTEREREFLSNSGVRLSQSGSQAGSVYWSKGSGSKQAELPHPGLITRGCAAPNSLAHSAIPLPLAYFGKDRQDCSLGWTPTYKKQVSVAGCSDEGGEWAGWGGVVAAQRWVGWGEEEGRERKRDEKRRNTEASLARALHSFNPLSFPSLP